MTTIIAIEGIGEAYAVRLRAVGIRSAEELLKSGAAPQGRRELAAKTGFSEQTILEWVNRADLFRIRGIGSQYSDLLEAAGVDTVRELANRNPEALLATLGKVNTEKNKVNKLPGIKMVNKWVENARTLPRGVEY